MWGSAVDIGNVPCETTETLTPRARSAANVPAAQRTSDGVTARRHHVLAWPPAAKTLVFCCTNGPVCATLNAGEDAAPVSTIPFALGSCPVHVSGMPCCRVTGAAAQPLPRSASFSSDACAALVPALV